jgi:hypothetical protein
MEFMKNKNSKIWAVVVIIVVIAIVFMVRAKNHKESSIDINNYGDMSQVQVEGTEDTTETKTPVLATNPATKLTYQQASTMYKDKRIQLDKTCQAFPNNVTYKNGTSIMIDNRAGVARTLNINGPVSIKAYGFKIVKLSSATLPKTILVDCGTGQNVATILLQK